MRFLYVFVIAASCWTTALFADESEKKLSGAGVLAFLNDETGDSLQKTNFVSETPLSDELANTYFQYLSSSSCRDSSLVGDIISKVATGGYRPVLEQHIVSYLKQEIEKAKAAPHYMSADPAKMVNILSAISSVPRDGIETSKFIIPDKIVTDYLHDELEDGEKPPLESFFEGCLAYLYLEYLKYTPSYGVAYHFFMSPGLLLGHWSDRFFATKKKNLLLEKLQANSSIRDASIFLAKLAESQILSEMNKEDVNVVVKYLCGNNGNKANMPSLQGYFDLSGFHIVRYWTHNAELDIGNMPYLYEYWQKIYISTKWDLAKTALETYKKSDNPLDIIIASMQLKSLNNYDYGDFFNIYISRVGEGKKFKDKTYIEHTFAVNACPDIPQQRVQEWNNYRQQVLSWLSTVTGEKIVDE